jgi:hypothetical protein
MTSVKDWVLVIPADGELKETIHRLLDLAEDPTHVRSQGNSDLLVPPYLADLFNEPKRIPRARRKKESGS